MVEERSQHLKLLFSRTFVADDESHKLYTNDTESSFQLILLIHFWRYRKVQNDRHFGTRLTECFGHGFTADFGTQVMVASAPK